MKILIFGGSGMLGHKLVQVLSPFFEVNYTVRGSFEKVEHFEFFRRDAAIENVDVTEFDLVRKVFEKAKPDVVINAAGVIKQVPQSKDIPKALTLNSIFPHQLAELSQRVGCRLLTMSTDCVFSGDRGNYTETDAPDALDLYGQSKHWGEVEQDGCLTIRTSI